MSKIDRSYDLRDVGDTHLTTPSLTIFEHLTVEACLLVSRLADAESSHFTECDCSSTKWPEPTTDLWYVVRLVIFRLISR